MKAKYSKEVLKALNEKKPLLALESTIITHGLKKPENLNLAKELENIVRENGVTPATIAVFNGVPSIGLEADELEKLAEFGSSSYKFSSYDLPVASGLKLTGSTTVAGTSFLAYQNGIKVFATGGIGGVHPQAHSRMDISHDLIALSKNPIVVISSGAKCILDLESTLEQLETLGVPIVGWKTKEFPAFYYNESGLKLSYEAKNLQDLVSIEKESRTSALLVANPVPKEFELDKNFVKNLILEAQKEAKKKHIVGKNLTPFLLNFLCEKSEGQTLKTNCALIKSNVELGSLLAYHC